MKNSPNDSNALPIKGNLTLPTIASILAAALMATASIAGLAFPSAVYPSSELVEMFLPNDVANLLIGLPMLLAAVLLARRGRLIGLLLWPGALFYVFYTYIIYVFAMPLNGAFLAHLALVVLSFYTLTGLLSVIDSIPIQKRLAGAVPERMSGAVLAVLGLLFFLRAAGALAAPVFQHTPPPEGELALLLTDFLVGPAWIIGGVALWRRSGFGYVTGLGLLFQASMLFIGLILVLLLQPSLTGAPFALMDVLVVFVMGLICFIPFGLFIRGVRASRRDATHATPGSNTEEV